MSDTPRTDEEMATNSSYGRIHPEFVRQLERELNELKKDKERLQEKYNELILAVASKYKGETRHQTALRYINERACPPESDSAMKEGK